jgi:hypothetical protein
MGEMNNAYKILVGISEGKRLDLSTEDNIRIDLREMEQ